MTAAAASTNMEGWPWPVAKGAQRWPGQVWPWAAVQQWPTAKLLGVEQNLN